MQIMNAALSSAKAKRPKRTSRFIELLKDTIRSPSAKIGAFLLIFIIIISIAAPIIAPYSPNDMNLSNAHELPSVEHLMGTDNMGRDMLSRLLYGGRYSLLIGFIGSAVTTIAAIIIGCLAGYFGGLVDMVIMRLMDILSALPAILMSILVSSVLGTGFTNTIIALSISMLPYTTRMMRAQVLSERSQEYLEAAQTINCPKASIIFKHMLPNALSPIIVCFTMGIGDNIATAASLSFIGLGVQPPTPEWGALLSSARTHMINYPFLIIFPGLFIAVTILAANLLGDGLRDALDPKLRK